MKTCYTIESINPPRLSIADLVDLDASRPSMLITRINVPAPLRGKGHGNRLLKQITNDADIAGVRLLVEVLPYGEMDFPALVGWYKRNGFVNKPGYPEHILERLPLQSKSLMPVGKEVQPT